MFVSKDISCPVKIKTFKSVYIHTYRNVCVCVYIYGVGCLNGTQRLCYLEEEGKRRPWPLQGRWKKRAALQLSNNFQLISCFTKAATFKWLIIWKFVQRHQVFCWSNKKMEKSLSFIFSFEWISQVKNKLWD